MIYCKIVHFPLRPIPSRAEEMIEDKLNKALQWLAAKNGTAMRPTSVSFLDSKDGLYMVVVAEPVTSQFEHRVNDYIISQQKASKS